MNKSIRKLHIVFLVVCLVLLPGCSKTKSKQNINQNSEQAKVDLTPEEYMNKIGSEISVLIKSTMFGDMN